ncbi:ATP-binding protein [Mesorhizobium sp. C089B]|uniref:HD domain-containing protein n=1 Tax=Mesorhizobium sp. C089B TaxID=2956823 RepID=UPI002575C3A2|nr:ATP-binding protein [Mesorhizobium sp. C089B]WJI53757.1 ATP-binding protein [Mesorhizobium sp. C089B]
MVDFRSTKTWSSSLEIKSQDKFGEERGILRSSFLAARTKASLLVQEIARDLPEYTSHDITHLDALWEYCDLIIGDSLDLNPAEAYVLGLSFLTHDAGMSLAAYPNGLDDLKKTTIWKDLSALYRSDINWSGLRVEADLDKMATAESLRLMHAEKSVDVANQFWVDRNGKQIYIIDDERLRNSFGEVIGAVAKSHWESIEKIHVYLNRIIGSPPFLPPEWTCDLLKLSCILRACDVAHLDSRRAPYFTQLFRNLPPISRDHWIFQEMLGRPIAVGDRLSYASTRRFSETESAAWWLCYDTLRYVDAELRSTDALLADTRTDCRLAVRGVSNVETPALMEKNVGTRDWVPVDAQIRISNVSKIVSILGGRGLYGDNPLVALRELIQNSCDAVRARRLIEGRGNDWEKIRVRKRVSDNGTYIDISDDGIGMSLEAINSKLLDFGSSYWESSLSYLELPGLYAKGYKSTGRFGIGFFSVFMLGDQVSVWTRRPSAPLEKTIELVFNSGISTRPFIRYANESKRLVDPGTIVSVKIFDKPEKLFPRGREVGYFSKSIERIACSCDVNIEIVDDGDGGYQLSIPANSWKELDPPGLVRRTFDADRSNNERFGSIKQIQKELMKDARRARPVIAKSGEILGFGFLNPRPDYYIGPELDGIITVGGLKADQINGLSGIFLGTTNAISRDIACLRGSREDYSDWISDQVNLIRKENIDFGISVGLAETLLHLGIKDESLPIMERAGPAASINDLRNFLRVEGEVKFIHDASLSLMRRSYAAVSSNKLGSIVLDDNVFSVRMGTRPIFPMRRLHFREEVVWNGDGVRSDFGILVGSLVLSKKSGMCQ